MSDRPLGVLHMLHRTPPASGVLAQALEAAQGLRSIGHRATVLTRTDAAVARRCAELGIPWISHTLRHPLDVASMRSLATTVDEGGIDVVHVHCGVTLGVALGAATLGSRFMLVANRASSFRPQRVLAQALRSARVHRVVATSRMVRDVLLAHAGLPAMKVAVVPGSVDPNRFDARRTSPLSARRRLGIPESARLVGHCGIREWKGWKHTLAAMPAILGAVPEAHLLLLGCSSERQRRGVGELVAEVRLDRQVTVGPVTAEVPDVLSACDLVVDASWAGTATSGVVREAMALGKPVVATAIGGNAELVDDGVSGVIVPPRDIATLAAAIVRLLRDTDLATTLGSAASERVRSEFSPEIRARRLVAIYRAAVAEHTAPRPK